MMKAYSRAGGQKVLLDTTLKQIKGIVRKHAGPEYDVEDISMHTYSRHINDAPFEFAIVVSASFSYIISHPSQ
jgi:hypothetical protein